MIAATRLTFTGRLVNKISRLKKGSLMPFEKSFAVYAAPCVSSFEATLTGVTARLRRRGLCILAVDDADCNYYRSTVSTRKRPEQAAER